MKTRYVRLVTLLLVIVMLLALSMNVMAARSDAVTQDGLTVQIFTDKDSYKHGESVKVTVQVDNHSGKKVSILTKINVPESTTLASQSATFKANLQENENWSTPGEVLFRVNSADTNTPATGDNAHVVLWSVLMALTLCCAIVLIVFCKKKAIWFSIILCVVMVGCLIHVAIPVQASDISGSVDVSCTIQVEGKNVDVSATVSYVIDSEQEDSTAPSEDTSEPTEHEHIEVIDAAKAPTCTETGLTAGKHCSVCNVVLVAQETVAALGHTEVIDAAVDATCTETGLTAGKHCSVCNVVLVAQETVAALGHTEVTDAAKTPTCTETGLTAGKHCSVCNEVLVAQETVAALGHTEVIDAAVDATCTETGLTAGKHCSVCNEVLVAQETVAALGHSGEWSVGTAPSYVNTGTLTRTCSTCEDVETVTLPEISEENGYVLKVTGVMSRWEYTHEGNAYNFDVVEDNAVTTSYSFGVEAWYRKINGEGTPIGTSGFKNTDAVWNGTAGSYGGSGKTYTTTIVVDETTTVTLYLKCAGDETVLAKDVLGNILVNGRKDGVIQNTTTQITGSGEYSDYAVATLFLEAGTNTIIFKTTDDINVKGIGFDSKETVTLAVDKIDVDLMSFNIRFDKPDANAQKWNNRKAALIQSVIDRNPDVVCFQEVEGNQYEDLKAGLETAGYEIVWYPRQGGQTEGLAIAYKTEIWEKESQSMFWLSATPDRQSKGWGSSYYRICVNTLLKHKATGQHLNVFSVHLCLTELPQVNGIKLVMNRAETENNYPTYIAGDFNCYSDDAAYLAIAEEYRDGRVYATVTDNGVTHNAWGDKADYSGTPIDFGFLSGEHFVVNEFEICREKYTWKNTNDVHLSDHYAIMTRVSLLLDQVYDDVVEHVHDEVVDEAVAPTCTETGMTEGRHCQTCGEILVAQQEVPALQHNIVVDEAVAASCTSTGLTEGSHCTRCDGATVVQTVVEKLPHEYDDDADTVCNICGFDRSVGCEHENTEPVGETKSATCDEPGSVAGVKCTDCGTILAEPNEIPATGHKFDESYTLHPTFDTAGEIGTACSNPNCEEKRVDVALPVLNTTDYTTETNLPEGATNALVTPVQATTTFTYNGAVEYSTSVEVSDILSVDLGDGRGSIYYSRYEVAKLCNENVTVIYDEATGYTCYAETAQNITHISVYGNDLTLTGTWNINPSKRIEIHDGNAYIGTAEQSATVTVTAVGDFAQSDMFIMRTGEDLTIASGSTLSLQSESQSQSNYPVNLLRANNNTTTDITEIHINGTLTVETLISMNQNNKLIVHEGGTVVCGGVNNGQKNTLDIRGSMTVNGNIKQTNNSVITIAETGDLSVTGNIELHTTGTKIAVNGGILTVGGNVTKCKTFTVKVPAVVTIVGTSNVTPTVPEGATVTINGKIIT